MSRTAVWWRDTPFSTAWHPPQGEVPDKTSVRFCQNVEHFVPTFWGAINIEHVQHFGVLSHHM
jgi:hypothetical protein